jgi:hypothetical protein
MSQTDIETTVVPLSYRDGSPVVSVNDETLANLRGWRVQHRLLFDGAHADRAKDTIKWVNRWANNRINWFRDLTLLPKIFITESALWVWPDVVNSLSEKGWTTLLPPTEWHIVISPHMTMTLESWKHREQLKQEFGDVAFGNQISINEMFREIGDYPQELEAERENFLGDSLSAVEALIGMLGATRVSLSAETPNREDGGKKSGGRKPKNKLDSLEKKVTGLKKEGHSPAQIDERLGLNKGRASEIINNVNRRAKRENAQQNRPK